MKREEPTQRAGSSVSVRAKAQVPEGAVVPEPCEPEPQLPAPHDAWPPEEPSVDEPPAAAPHDAWPPPPAAAPHDAWPPEVSVLAEPDDVSCDEAELPPQPESPRRAVAATASEVLSVLFMSVSLRRWVAGASSRRALGFRGAGIIAAFGSAPQSPSTREG